MKRIFGAKSKLLVSILMVLCIMTVGSTMAYLFATSDLLKNTFSSAELDTGINDEGSGTNKTVSITNKGKSPAWVRARLLVSGIAPDDVVILQNALTSVEHDQIGLVMPKIDMNDKNSQWQSVESYNQLMAGDGWIYYTQPLPSLGETSNLLEGVVFGEGVNPNTITITVTHESVLALDTSGITPWVDAFNTPAGSVPSPTPTT